MKLEVGMYVRTKNGMIAKIVSKEDVSGSLHRKEMVFILDNGNRLALNSKKVIKASKNIIDLIKVGDCVNGLTVVYNARNNGGNIVIVINGNAYNEKEIRSVVTKEQFDSVRYEVE